MCTCAKNEENRDDTFLVSGLTVDPLRLFGMGGFQITWKILNPCKINDLGNQQKKIFSQFLITCADGAIICSSSMA